MIKKINSNYIVLSLGGSLIYPPSGIDIKFLRKFNDFIREQVKKGRKFFIVCGGGKICRNYQEASKETIANLTNEDVDWMGIHATRMNAQLLRTIFADICLQKVIYNYNERESNVKEPVVIAAGWKPGWSTDYCATLLARDYGAKTIINLSNIKVVYDKDPNKYDNAKPIHKISWENFKKLVGEKWEPGANLPFDPVATKLANNLGLTAFIVKGNDFNNLEKVLEGKPFKGTIIMPVKLDSSFYNKEYYELGIGYKGYTTTITGRILNHLTNMYRAVKIRFMTKAKSFLDVGCGPGLLVYYLRKLGIEAYGVEISHYALSKAHPSIKKYLKYGDILNLPYKNNQFGAVNSANVLEHLQVKDIPKALSECDRVCSIYSGHKIYTSENKWIEKFHSGDLSHVSIYPREWWMELFKKEGYTVLKYPTLPSVMESIFVLEKRKKVNAS